MQHLQSGILVHNCVIEGTLPKQCNVLPSFRLHPFEKLIHIFLHTLFLPHPNDLLQAQQSVENTIVSKHDFQHSCSGTVKSVYISSFLAITLQCPGSDIL